MQLPIYPKQKSQTASREQKTEVDREVIMPYGMYCCNITEEDILYNQDSLIRKKINTRKAPPVILSPLPQQIAVVMEKSLDTT